MPDVQEAQLLIERGEARKAVDILSALVEAWPGYASAHVLLARAYEALEAPDRALDAWREATQVMPGSPVILEGLRRAASACARFPDDLDRELDRLIAELGSGRVGDTRAAVPRVEGGEPLPPNLESDVEGIASVTLAAIYASQAMYDEAARVYEILAAQDEERRTEFLAKVAEMQRRGLPAS